MFIVSSTNWALLRSQKLTLIQVIGVSPPAVAEDLTGILHLIDAIQDEAAWHLGEAEVFGDEVDVPEELK